jgi:hypothetical protein
MRMRSGRLRTHERCSLSMSELSDDLVPLTQAARRLRVPTQWLRVEAESGRIPHLSAGGRLLVHMPTVQRVLIERARVGFDGQSVDADVHPAIDQVGGGHG